MYQSTIWQENLAKPVCGKTEEDEILKLKSFKQNDTVFMVVNNILLIIAFLLVIYPLIYIISASFSSPQAVVSGKVIFFPVDFSLEGYTAVFKNDSILTGYGNTIFYTVFGTLFNVFMTLLAAYPLSRKKFKGRNLIAFMFTFTMIFHGGLIPTYILMQKLGMVNTRWVMIIPEAIGVWNVIITRTFLQTSIGDELFEAAQLDGCDHFMFLSKIVLPLSKAIMAVLVLFYGVAHWNSFFTAFIYLRDEKLFPLQIILRDILISSEILSDDIVDQELMEAKQGLADLLKYSLIIVSSLPVWIAYPFVQKHFVKGVMVGAIKG